MGSYNMDSWPELGRRIHKPIRQWRKDIRRRARRMRLLPGSTYCGSWLLCEGEPGPYRKTHTVVSSPEAIATGLNTAPVQVGLKRKYFGDEPGRVLVPNHEQPNGDCPWCGPNCKAESAVLGTSLPRCVISTWCEAPMFSKYEQIGWACFK